MSTVEFVSYDGEYPNLCSGTLKLRINGETVTFPEYCMHPGGCVTFDADYNPTVSNGAWSVDVPEEYEGIRHEIEYVVNQNVRQGCCGGCI